MQGRGAAAAAAEAVRECKAQRRLRNEPAFRCRSAGDRKTRQRDFVSPWKPFRRESRLDRRASFGRRGAPMQGRGAAAAAAETVRECKAQRGLRSGPAFRCRGEADHFARRRAFLAQRQPLR